MLDLNKLQTAQEEHIAKVRENGGKITTYRCGHCESDIETVQPNKTMVGKKGYWDSSKTCPKCGAHNFVITHVDGKTETALIFSPGQIDEE